jgi:hypothetical protein
MNKLSPSAVPDENKIEELLARMQPVPSGNFHKKMERASWLDERGSKKTMSSYPRLRLAFVIITLLGITILAVTPPGRAWAREVFQFFQKVDFTTIPLSEKEVERYNYVTTTKVSYDLPLVPILIPTVIPEIASLPGCDTPEKALSYSCQIAHAEAQLGFELMEFPEEPRNLEFKELWFDKSTKSTIIDYESRSTGQHLRLSQRLGKAPEQYYLWPWVPASDVEKIKVGSFDGEYVSGFFQLPMGGHELVWNDTNSSQRVAWSDGTTWYLLDSAGIMDRERVIELAASLVTAPTIVEKHLDPDALDATLVSISEAEAYSGQDLKAPTILPIGFSFSYAHYSALKSNEVSLRYDGSNLGANGYIIIYERKETFINFDSLSTAHGNYEIVKVKGQSAFYGFTNEGPSPYLLLWWREGELTYQMYFYWYNDSVHGVIDKQKMIAIAESMQDINVFKNRTPRPYESVTIYEEALGIDILEFSTTPAGLSFAGFWAEAWDKCIGLSYTSTTMQGGLSLTQCGTDRLFEISDVPATAIERVTVGRNQAQYITGGSGYNSHGMQVWQPDLPVRQLRWQESGLWIQMTVSGEITALPDREDLISIAESLR